MRQRRFPALAALSLGLYALHTSAGGPQRAWTELQAGLHDTADPFAALTPALAGVAWVLAGWLALVALLTAASAVPGAGGRCAAALTRRTAPAAVRRAVQVALGLGLAAGVTCASPASAASLAESPVASTAVASVPSLDWPASAPPPAAPPAATAAPSAGAVVVAPGDSLWSLAERALGPGAADHQVAAAWPRWWAANRDAVGPDPHVIQPGTRLTPPAPSS